MKTVISVKVDEDVKESAQAIAKSMGISLSSLVNSYLRQVSATRRVELYAPEEMTPQLEQLVAEVEKERSAGLTAGPFDSVEDMMKDLRR